MLKVFLNSTSQRSYSFWFTYGTVQHLPVKKGGGGGRLFPIYFWHEGGLVLDFLFGVGRLKPSPPADYCTVPSNKFKQLVIRHGQALQSDCNFSTI